MFAGLAYLQRSENEVAAYNPVRVSEEFRQWADLAEAMLRADSSRLAIDRNAYKRHDELLAGLAVYRYLQDGHFLATPELLLCELRLLRANGQPRTPETVLNVVAFVTHRQQLLETLIVRFQSMLAIRDALGAGEEPAAPAHKRRSSTPMPPMRNRTPES
jgi:hypothetical protein